MLKDIVSNQKLQKEQLSTLAYIGRTKEPFAKKWLDSSLIKVVLGPRRAGKSVFSLVLLKDRPFMYFNFDDEVLSSTGGVGTNELMKELHAAYGQVKTVWTVPRILDTSVTFGNIQGIWQDILTRPKRTKSFWQSKTVCRSLKQATNTA